MASVTSHKELVAWQLCQELAEAVCELLAKGPGSRDRNFCDQLRRAADAPAPLIAEGFGRGTPGEAVRYLRMAIGSLRETSTFLERGTTRAYWPEGEASAVTRLCWRALDITREFLAAKKRQRDAQEQERRAHKHTKPGRKP